MNTKTKRVRRAASPSNALKAIKAKYPHVKKVTAIGVKAQAIRVEIQCIVTKCTERREIATQDAFQVKRCRKHQREFAASKRRKTPKAA